VVRGDRTQSGQQPHAKDLKSLPLSPEATSKSQRPSIFSAIF